jgi:hypothetical protein
MRPQRWDEARMLNFLRMPVDVIKKPRYYGVPLRPYKTGLDQTLSLFDDASADQV